MTLLEKFRDPGFLLDQDCTWRLLCTMYYLPFRMPFFKVMFFLCRIFLTLEIQIITMRSHQGRSQQISLKNRRCVRIFHQDGRLLEKSPFFLIGDRSSNGWCFFKDVVYFHPWSLGKWSNLTTIFWFCWDGWGVWSTTKPTGRGKYLDVPLEGSGWIKDLLINGGYIEVITHLL